MKTFIFSIVIGLILIGCGGNKDTSTPADFELQINEERDLSFLNELLDDNENNPENYLRLARLYMQEDQFEKAINILEKGNSNIPTNSQIRLLLANALIKNDQLDEASKLIDLNSTIENNSLLFYQTASQYWFAEEEYAKSLNNINLAINIDQGNGELYALKAENLLHLNDTLGAINNYYLSLGKENTSFSTYIDFLNLLISVNDQDLFDKIFRELSPEYLDHFETHFLLANYLVKKGSYDSAKAHLFGLSGDAALELRKIKLLADINYQQKLYDSALYYLSDYEIISPDLLLLQARAYDKRGNYIKSEESYLKIIEMDSTDAIAIDELAKLRRKVRYLQLKKREENRIQIIPSNPISPVN